MSTFLSGGCVGAGELFSSAIDIPVLTVAFVQVRNSGDEF
jgi:hypothetical protein